MKSFLEFIYEDLTLGVNESLVSKLEKVTKSKLKDGRNTWFGYPVDLDANEDPSEGGLTVDAVDRAAKTGVIKQLKDNGFKVTNAKGNSFVVVESKNTVGEKHFDHFLTEASMSKEDKALAVKVHKALSQDDSMSKGAGEKIKAAHQSLRSKYGKDWRKMAGITEALTERISADNYTTHI